MNKILFNDKLFTQEYELIADLYENNIHNCKKDIHNRYFYTHNHKEIADMGERFTLPRLSHFEDGNFFMLS